MSRRGKAVVKRVTLDPKYNSELVAHMIRVVMNRKSYLADYNSNGHKESDRTEQNTQHKVKRKRYVRYHQKF